MEMLYLRNFLSTFFLIIIIISSFFEVTAKKKQTQKKQHKIQSSGLLCTALVYGNHTLAFPHYF